MNCKQLIIFNAFDFGSTGVLCNYLKESVQNDFRKPIFVCSNAPKTGHADVYLYSETSKLYRKKQIIKAKLFNSYGFIGKKATRDLLSTIKKRIVPGDEIILSIHQIESSLFDLSTLLKYAKKENARVFITLHDCWLFTGKCAYYDISKCEKWKTKCDICPNFRDFPSTFCKKIKKGFDKKISLLIEYKDYITCICPSLWIEKQLEKSLLKDLKHTTIHNGIDSFAFNQMNGSEKSLRIGLIAAASPWTERKGLKYLKYLSNNLDYSKYSLTILGLDDFDGFSDKTVLHKILDRQSLFLEFMKNDYFLNPTLEDNFPTTNIEALSCGLKIVSFDTGGSCEAFDNTTGVIIKEKTEQSLVDTVNSLKKNENKGDCINRAKMYFSKDIFVSKYYNLFRNGSKRKI